jgi:gamma-glutamyl-gamma-aminobutyrate hydrolase PuuD
MTKISLYRQYKKNLHSTQKTLWQVGVYSQNKHKSLISKATKAYLAHSKPPVGIALRQCGGGKGAYYDHYTLQLTTQTPTVVLKQETMKIANFVEQLRQVTHSLQYEVSNIEDYKTSAEATPKEFGLLFIPGVSRKSYEREDFEVRKQFQSDLIKRAVLEGRPILAICGGCWQLWEEFGGKVKEVKGHSYRAGMPRILDTTGKVGYNKQIHRLNLEADSHILCGAMMLPSFENQSPTVNSVHWLAPSDEIVPSFLDVSAKSVADESIAPKITRDGETRVINPDTCIEAFESKNGVPIIGVQWHPEAYTKNSPESYKPRNQISILKYMIESGKSFQLKKKMVCELKNIFRRAHRTPWQRHKLRQIKIKGIRFFQINKNSCLINGVLRSETTITHLFETMTKKECFELANKKKRKYSEL